MRAYSRNTEQRESRSAVTLKYAIELHGFQTRTGSDSASMLETETDSEAEASEVVVKRRAILWDMAVGEQIRYEVATIRKCMVILGRRSSFFCEGDPETGEPVLTLGGTPAPVVW